jgi:hypothetical protein
MSLLLIKKYKCSGYSLNAGADEKQGIFYFFGLMVNILYNVPLYDNSWSEILNFRC